MRRPGIALATGLTAVMTLSACGTELAPSATDQPNPTSPTPVASPKRATPRPAKCLPSGHLITRTEIDAALGLRAITLTLRNCRQRPLVVHDHPAIAVLDQARRPFPITVTRETPDGPPGTFQLKPGETFSAVLTWRNTVTDDDSIKPMQAAYLRVAAAKGDPTAVIPLDETFGNTGKARVSPMVPAELIATAFGLASPRGPLTPVQHTSFQTWRLATADGDYLVKRLWEGDDPHWWSKIEQAMRYEQLAIEAGVPTAVPVEPVRPSFGRAARVGGYGSFRVYQWIPHRELAETDDITDWLAETLVTLHRLEPLAEAPTIEWRWWGVETPEVWVDWMARAGDRPWAKARLDNVFEVSARIRDVLTTAGDFAVCHGDFEPRNVLMAADGPVLIDWESVAPGSASLEAGRAAAAFGDHDVERVEQFLQAYEQAGGSIVVAPQDLMLHSVAAELSKITEQIRAVLGDQDGAIPGWIDLDKADDRITAGLNRFSERAPGLSP